MENKLSCIFILIIFITGVSSVTPSVYTVATGKNVTFNVNVVNITAGTWLFESTTLVFWYPGNIIFDDNYKDRVLFNLSTLQLSLRSVQVNDSGLYVLQGVSPNVRNENLLYVQEPITNVTLTASKTNLVEFNDSVTFTCSANGTSLTFSWRNSSSEVSAGVNVQLSSDGSVLTISNVTTYDQGPFTCTVANGISNGTSGPIYLNISYGPCNVTISGPAIAETDSSVTLNCSASSQPPSDYSWYFHGSKVAEGAVFETGSLSLNSSGEYTCTAHNNITGLRSSAKWNLTVVEGISSVLVNPSMPIPLASQDLQLFCNVTGLYNSIAWLKDNQTFWPHLTDNVSADNTTLAFNPLQISDDGAYQCVATNIFGEHVSKPYKLTANYGPVNLKIEDKGLLLICEAESQPPSLYHWIFNNDLYAGEGPTITVPLMIPVGSKYTCVAMNPLTNVTLFGSYIVSDYNTAAPRRTSALLTAVLVLLLLSLWL